VAAASAYVNADGGLAALVALGSRVLVRKGRRRWRQEGTGSLNETSWATDGEDGRRSYTPTSFLEPIDTRAKR
jgi:hypothetical protein